MITCKIRRIQYFVKSAALLIMYTLPVLLHAQINIAFNLNNHPVAFGVTQLEEAFNKAGQQVNKIDLAAGYKNANIVIQISDDQNHLSIQKEGFEIAYKNKQLVISAIDAAGAMYGALDVAEQVQYFNPV